MLDWKIKIVLTDYHRSNICLDEICKFLSLIKEDLEMPWKPNMTVKDYTLEQFQWWIWKKIDVLDPNNKKWRKQNR